METTVDSRVWKIQSKRLGDDPAPYTTVQLFAYAEELNRENEDGSQFELRDCGTKIVDDAISPGNKGHLAAVPYVVTVAIIGDIESVKERTALDDAAEAASLLERYCEALNESGLFEISCDPAHNRFSFWHGGEGSKNEFRQDREIPLGFIESSFPEESQSLMPWAEYQEKANQIWESLKSEYGPSMSGRAQ